MALRFNKRKKILPGVYVNLSKKGLSTTIGPKGASVNISKRGTYLNTSIPGTGISSRKKISGTSTKSNSTNKSYFTNSNNNYSTNQNSYKKKNAAILLSFFLGTFGVHRFYLRQYVRGVLYLIFSWTLIPTFISFIDMIMFAVMSDEKFNLKYNSNITLDGSSNIQNFKPTNSLPLSNNSNEVNSTDNTKTREFTYQYYTLIKDFYYSLSTLIQKLNTNNEIIEQINNANVQAPTNEFITNCVLYDMVQISNILSDNKFSTGSLEATGLVLSTYPFLPKVNENLILEKDFDLLALSHKKGILKEMAQTLIDISSIENPMQISLNNGNNENSNIENKLSFPTFLKISENPLFEEYATVLYRYATIISKADNIVTKKEENLLNQIYQFTHNPILEKKNEALHISKADKNESLNSVLEELNSLIGLDEVKSEINTLINFIKIQKEREKSGLKSSTLSYHIVFTGNPGTGKTTVARIVAKIYKHLGILTEGQLVETDRSGLVAEYSGQTAPKVNKTVNSALNGILFIDEAYSLVGENKDDFGKEAVATLIKRMEDDRDKLVLVLAGYSNEMKQFIDTNPGFQSRFNRYINFPDYSAEDLFKIFKSKCDKLDYKLTEDAEIKLREEFEKAYSNRDKSFGNGRFVRNVFEKTLEKQANRIAKESNLTKEILTTIEKDDIV